MQSEVKIFSGTSNIVLAKRISEKLDLNLSKVEIGKFKDGEIFVSVKEKVDSCHCIVVQSLCNPVNDNLMELLIIVDALKRSHAKRITAVIPYMGYSRQDRRCNSGDPITAKIVANMISNSGVNEVILCDLHANQIEGFFDVPVSNISNFENFADDIKRIENFSPENFVFVAPDVGAAKKTRAFSKFLNCDMAIIDKNRSKANCSEVMNVIGNVKGKNIILIDDIVDTAGTISNAAKVLVEKEKAKDVYIYATHAVCSGNAVNNLSVPYIKQVVFSDSIPLESEKLNLRIISISNILAREIMKIFNI